jgi:hypothetical protein
MENGKRKTGNGKRKTENGNGKRERRTGKCNGEIKNSMRSSCESRQRERSQLSASASLLNAFPINPRLEPTSTPNSFRS